MNILLLTPQPPLPAYQGTALRNWGILRHLSKHHSITLITFAAADSAEPVELAHACRSIEWVAPATRGLVARLRTAAAGLADMAMRLESPEFDATIRRVLNTAAFDLAQIEGLELGRYILTLRQCCPTLPILYDAHNAEVTIQQRAWRSDRSVPSRWTAAAYSRLQMGRLGRFEGQVCRQANAVTCVSELDASALRLVAPGLQPTVVPNGIELTDYPLAADEVQPELLTFTGKMDYRPNVDAALWFTNEVLPRIRAVRPAVRFEIVGQNPTEGIAKLNGQGGVRVLGTVPDTRPFIAHSAAYVAPLRMGGGTRFKLLEAMALGRPVVSTSIGAEGFSIQSGREMLIADAAEEFAGAVLRVLIDAELAHQIGLAGRAFVVAGYDWAAIIPRLEAAQRRVVDKVRAERGQ